MKFRLEYQIWETAFEGRITLERLYDFPGESLKM